MLIFEAWNHMSAASEYAIKILDEINVSEANILREAYKKCDGLMDLLLMKIDSMEDEITITRDEISEVLK